MIGISITAVNIPEKVIKRCYKSIVDANIKIPYRVNIQTTCEGRFSISAARNQGVCALVPYCEKIITLDVDCLVPPGLIECVDGILAPRTAVCTLARHVSDFDGTYQWDKWSSLDTIPDGRGAFVAMTTEDWYLTGGFDERQRGWGGEDTVMFERQRSLGIKTIQIRNFPLVHIEHPLHWGNTDEFHLDNIRIGKTTPPCNYLAGKIRIPPQTLYLWTNAACTHSCKFCMQQRLMRLNPAYEMSMKDLEMLIDAIKQSKYPQFPFVDITGGEPMLWSNVEDGLRLLYEADIGPIHVFTNATRLETMMRVDKYVSMWRISVYEWNKEEAKRAKATFPGKIWPQPDVTHMPMPDGPFGVEVLPADCGGPGWLVYDGYIYPCCNLPGVPLWYGYKLEDMPRCPIQPGFIEVLMAKRRRIDEFCRRCVGNVNIQKWVASFPVL